MEIEFGRAELLRGLLQEPRALLELARWPSSLSTLAAQPRGDGKPVLLLPGFAAGDSSMLALRAYLHWLGYRARGWRLGLNRGGVERQLPRVMRRAERLAERAGQRVSLVGWSLGGHLARELAREREDLVERVITLGSPVLRRSPTPPDRVPVVAVFSRRDGVVPWPASIDGVCPGVRHVEVDTTHLGMVLSPEVFGVVARVLAGG